MLSNKGYLKIFPGISEKVVEATLQIEGLRGLILETYGAGNAPTFDWFIDKLATAIKQGLIVYNVTQCNAGRVEQGRYENSRLLKEIGVVSGFDITTEAAVTKMMFLLAQNMSEKEIKYYLEHNIAGELSRA